MIPLLTDETVIVDGEPGHIDRTTPDPADGLGYPTRSARLSIHPLDLGGDCPTIAELHIAVEFFTDWHDEGRPPEGEPIALGIELTREGLDRLIEEARLIAGFRSAPGRP